MINMGIVRGSSAQAIPLVIGKDTVYVHTDIKKVDTSMDDIPIDDLYEYHEYQYDKDEYIGMLQLRPYTETKTAYIGDTEVTFLNTPSGNLTVYFPYEYTVERLTDRIVISFNELQEVTDVTISIL